jgi:hypothetical protein
MFTCDSQTSHFQKLFRSLVEEYSLISINPNTNLEFFKELKGYVVFDRCVGSSRTAGPKLQFRTIL